MRNIIIVNEKNYLDKKAEYKFGSQKQEPEKSVPEIWKNIYMLKQISNYLTKGAPREFNWQCFVKLTSEEKIDFHAFPFQYRFSAVGQKVKNNW